MLPRDEVAISHQIGAATYRIAQEALTNIVRHAHASKATVHVSCRDRAIEISVRDNGVGPNQNFAATPGTTHGINGMRERARVLRERARVLGGTLTPVLMVREGSSCPAISP